ncbi:hypothetical protein LTR29_006427 [Friedmanniomyces endolithicus]|nr:hypothetical protein LTR29_006427 [Friedmanniomyces endolithicus]
MEQPFEKMAEEGVPKCDKPSEVSAPKKEDQDLPKMSPQEFRVYNRMAEHMDMFHENFRRTWNLLYGACTSGKRPAGMSLRAFLNTGAGILPPPHRAPHDRRTAHFPRARAENAGVQAGARVAHAA